MYTPVQRAKASLLLHLIYYHDRSTGFHFENVAFFELSDESVCCKFMKKLNVTKKEFEGLVDLLFKKKLVRFVQFVEFIFVHLEDQACRFVLTEHPDDLPYLFRGTEK